MSYEARQTNDANGCDHPQLLQSPQPAVLKRLAHEFASLHIIEDIPGHKKAQITTLCGIIDGHDVFTNSTKLPTTTFAFQSAQSTSGTSNVQLVNTELNNSTHSASHTSTIPVNSPRYKDVENVNNNTIHKKSTQTVNEVEQKTHFTEPQKNQLTQSTLSQVPTSGNSLQSHGSNVQYSTNTKHITSPTHTNQQNDIHVDSIGFFVEDNIDKDIIMTSQKTITHDYSDNNTNETKTTPNKLLINPTLGSLTTSLTQQLAAYNTIESTIDLESNWRKLCPHTPQCFTSLICDENFKKLTKYNEPDLPPLPKPNSNIIIQHEISGPTCVINDQKYYQDVQIERTQTQKINNEMEEKKTYFSSSSQYDTKQPPQCVNTQQKTINYHGSSHTQVYSGMDLPISGYNYSSQYSFFPNSTMPLKNHHQNQNSSQQIQINQQLSHNGTKPLQNIQRAYQQPKEVAAPGCVAFYRKSMNLLFYPQQSENGEENNNSFYSSNNTNNNNNNDDDDCYLSPHLPPNDSTNLANTGGDALKSEVSHHHTAVIPPRYADGSYQKNNNNFQNNNNNVSLISKKNKTNPINNGKINGIDENYHRNVLLLASNNNSAQQAPAQLAAGSTIGGNQINASVVTTTNINSTTSIQPPTSLSLVASLDTLHPIMQCWPDDQILPITRATTTTTTMLQQQQPQNSNSLRFPYINNNTISTGVGGMMGLLSSHREEDSANNSQEKEEEEEEEGKNNTNNKKDENKNDDNLTSFITSFPTAAEFIAHGQTLHYDPKHPPRVLPSARRLKSVSSHHSSSHGLKKNKQYKNNNNLNSLYGYNNNNTTNGRNSACLRTSMNYNLDNTNSQYPSNDIYDDGDDDSDDGSLIPIIKPAKNSAFSHYPQQLDYYPYGASTATTTTATATRFTTPLALTAASSNATNRTTNTTTTTTAATTRDILRNKNSHVSATINKDRTQHLHQIKRQVTTTTTTTVNNNNNSNTTTSNNNFVVDQQPNNTTTNNNITMNSATTNNDINTNEHCQLQSVIGKGLFAQPQPPPPSLPDQQQQVQHQQQQQQQQQQIINRNNHDIANINTVVNNNNNNNNNNSRTTTTTTNTINPSKPTTNTTRLVVNNNVSTILPVVTPLQYYQNLDTNNNNHNNKNNNTIMKYKYHYKNNNNNNNNPNQISHSTRLITYAGTGPSNLLQEEIQQHARQYHVMHNHNNYHNNNNNNGQFYVNLQNVNISSEFFSPAPRPHYISLEEQQQQQQLQQQRCAAPVLTNGNSMMLQPPPNYNCSYSKSFSMNNDDDDGDDTANGEGNNSMNNTTTDSNDSNNHINQLQTNHYVVNRQQQQQPQHHLVQQHLLQQAQEEGQQHVIIDDNYMM